MTASMTFATMARFLAVECRANGLVTPAFRSPPRTWDDRTLRREGGTATVAVRIKDRADADVAHDMIEGIIAANRVDGAIAYDISQRLLAALDPVLGGPHD